MKLTITWIGQPKDVQTKFGVKQKNSIKAEEYADNYLSYWIGNQTSGWKLGDVVEVENIIKREYKGKTYYDIVMPKMSNGVDKTAIMALSQKIDAVITNQKRIIDHLSGKKILDSSILNVPTNVEYPIDEINPNDMPF